VRCAEKWFIPVAPMSRRKRVETTLIIGYLFSVLRSPRPCGLQLVRIPLRTA
jgi:hypothetical protein